MTEPSSQAETEPQLPEGFRADWEREGFFSGEPVKMVKPRKIPPPPVREEEESTADDADSTDGGRE